MVVRNNKPPNPQSKMKLNLSVALTISITSNIIVNNLLESDDHDLKTGRVHDFEKVRGLLVHNEQLLISMY